MSKRIVLLLVLLVAAGTGLRAQDTQPAEQTAASDVSPEARAVLDQLQAAGETYTSLRAEILYGVENRLTGDVEMRTGWVAYQDATEQTPTKFRVSFQTLQLGEGQPAETKVDYIFDGHWLIIAKHAIQSMTRIQIAAEGEQIEPLNIGKGPFPVPFGQNAAEVVRLLEVTLLPPAEGDPPASDHLLLVPRAEHKHAMNFTRLDLWVDRQRHLPVKIITRDASKNRTSVLFETIQTNAELRDDWFSMEKPAGWSLSVERLPE
jgi:hypothetical protein